MSKRKIDIEKREKKKLLRIRKIAEIIKRLAVIISSAGAVMLLYVIFFAPEIVAEGNYYAALFACISAVLSAPAVFFIEEQIKYDGKKEEE